MSIKTVRRSQRQPQALYEAGWYDRIRRRELREDQAQDPSDEAASNQALDRLHDLNGEKSPRHWASKERS